MGTPILTFGHRLGPIGNYFAIDLVGPHAGVVTFVDHESFPVDTTALTEVAASFPALLERLGGSMTEASPPTTVSEAIAKGDADALRVLLAGGCGATGFVHRAVRTGSLEVVRLVLEHGGDANERNEFTKETPLFAAAREDRADMVALLLAHRADPNARCGVGGTALEMAAPWVEVVEVLARAGAEPTTNRLRAAVDKILKA